jgi:hypothetical protein
MKEELILSGFGLHTGANHLTGLDVWALK